MEAICCFCCAYGSSYVALMFFWLCTFSTNGSLYMVGNQWSNIHAVRQEGTTVSPVGNTKQFCTVYLNYREKTKNEESQLPSENTDISSKISFCH